MSNQEYIDHPLSSVLPLMSQTELRELAADIQGSGLRAPITLLDGKILDGRNRYRACQMVGVEPRYKEYNGDGDPIDFIVSVNVKRRHLTASQKAMVVAKILDLPRGNPNLKTSKSPIKPKSVQSTELKTAERVAKEVDVSTSTVEQAKRVLRDAPKETVKRVERGEKSVATAVREIRKDKEQKAEHLDKTGYPVPDSISSDWQRAAEWSKGILNLVSQARSQLKSALEDEDIILAELSNTTVADLNNAYTSLKCVVPYAICTTCQGRQSKKCSLCKGRGFISEFAWKTYVPKEVKAIREKAVKR